MQGQVTLNNIQGVPPYTIWVCSGSTIPPTINSCILIADQNTTPPSPPPYPFIFLVPDQFSAQTSLILWIKDDENCDYYDTITQTIEPTPTPTPTSTPSWSGSTLWRYVPVQSPTPSVTSGYIYPTPSITKSQTPTPSVTSTNTPTPTPSRSFGAQPQDVIFVYMGNI